MAIKNYFEKTVSYFRRNRRTNAITTTMKANELTDTRFGIGKSTVNEGKIAPANLTFLMYSKDNDNLFI